MTEFPPPDKPDRTQAPPALTDRARADQAAREQRQAEALRANLRRRKDQQRARSAEPPEIPE